MLQDGTAAHLQQLASAAMIAQLQQAAMMSQSQSQSQQASSGYSQPSSSRDVYAYNGMQIPILPPGMLMPPPPQPQHQHQRQPGRGSRAQSPVSGAAGMMLQQTHGQLHTQTTIHLASYDFSTLALAYIMWREMLRESYVFRKAQL